MNEYYKGIYLVHIARRENTFEITDNIIKNTNQEIFINDYKKYTYLSYEEYLKRIRLKIADIIRILKHKIVYQKNYSTLEVTIICDSLEAINIATAEHIINIINVPDTTFELIKQNFK